MHSEHHIDLELNNSPCYKDDLDFINLIFTQAFHKIDRDSLCTDDPDNTDIYNEGWIRIGDNAGIEFEFDRFQYGQPTAYYTIHVKIPDIFNSKRLTIENTPQEMAHKYLQKFQHLYKKQHKSNIPKSLRTKK